MSGTCPTFRDRGQYFFFGPGMPGSGIIKQGIICRRSARFLWLFLVAWVTVAIAKREFLYISGSLPMPTHGSVTRWIDQMQAGDPDAVRELWGRYFRRLVGLARQRLRNAPRRAADEEDVALSAFDSFCRHAEEGRFPDLLDRDSLWRLLVVMTARKASHLIRDETRQKRGGAGIGDLPDGGGDVPILETVLSREPTPDLAAQVAEECQRLLGELGDKELEQVAVWRMEGYAVDDIAGKLDCAPRSVKRKLQLIRDIWQKAGLA